MCKKDLFSLGSMVQKGKFSAGASLFVRMLKKVDLPTLGSPTIPTFKLVPTRPISGLASGTAFFLGGIVENEPKHEIRHILIRKINTTWT